VYFNINKDRDAEYVGGFSTTLTKSTGPCASACVDRAPDKGWLPIAA
jgi:hypothetical protein